MESVFADGEVYVWALIGLPVGVALIMAGKQLLGRFSPSRRENGGYTVFTREFDREVHARDLDRIFSPLSQKAAEQAEQDRTRYEAQLVRQRRIAASRLEEATRRLREGYTDRERADFFITLLVDQSGSLMGEPILLAASACSLAQDFITDLGVGCEVLGFTTSTWKGGKSREKWRRQGAYPKAVGRLCDLLHIIYRDGDERGVSDNPIYKEMLRPGLLKENVDGEAIQWAIRRLRTRRERHKILIVISDGAPVDDSTLSNNDLEILGRHLRRVIARAQAAGDIKLAALGLGFDLSNYYRDATILANGDELAMDLAAAIERLMRKGAGR